MKTLVSFILFGSLISSCNQSSPAAFSKAPIDSLILNWEKSWNKHDSVGVRNLFISDALLIDDNLLAMNAQELSDKWIHPNINVVNNLTSTKVQDWSSSDKASYTGKYTLDVVVNDSIVAHPTGVYTVNWTKTEKGDWKIITAHIHSFSRTNN